VVGSGLSRHKTMVHAGQPHSGGGGWRCHRYRYHLLPSHREYASDFVGTGARTKGPRLQAPQFSRTQGDARTRDGHQGHLEGGSRPQATGL
jgi:hypothetical protein